MQAGVQAGVQAGGQASRCKQECWHRLGGRHVGRQIGRWIDKKLKRAQQSSYRLTTLKEIVRGGGAIPIPSLYLLLSTRPFRK